MALLPVLVFPSVNFNSTQKDNNKELKGKHLVAFAEGL